jgi:hypothetical protein
MHLFDKELRRSASHEAGHAAVAVHLAVPFECVEVRPDGTGGVHLPSSTDADESTIPQLARKQVIVAYAGAAAQRMFHPDQPDREITQCSFDDRAKIQNIVQDFPEIDSEQAKAEAESLIHELRAVIQETSDALLRSETLTLIQEDVQKIYAALLSP